MGQVVRLIDYLAGRSSGQYKADNPFWHKRANPYQNIRCRTVVDSIDNALEPRLVAQQTPIGTSQYSPSPMYPAMQIMDVKPRNRFIPRYNIKLKNLNDW